MSPSPLRLRQRLRRRAADLIPDGASAAVLAGASALARTAPARSALERRVASSLRDVADVAATRLLSLDDAASHLAMLVEELAARHDRDDVTRILLRRNLVLDGTFLALLEPILSGGDVLAAAPETVDRGIETIAQLLADLVALDTRRDAGDDPLAFLQQHLDSAAWDALHPLLSREAEFPDRARFVMLSYALFLESWLVRFTARTVGSMLDTRADLAALDREGNP